MLAPNILIVGTGAVGSLYGGFLAKAGAKVTTVCRSDYHHVAKQGISIKSPWENMQFMPENVIANLKEYTKVPDYIIVSTKALPSLELWHDIQPILGPKTGIVLWQNGIDIETAYHQAFPTHTLISALSFVCVTKTGPGQVIHQDYGQVMLGLYPSGTSAQVENLQLLCQQGGIPCRTSTQIQQNRWEKLVWNAAFNPLSVIEESTTQALLSHPHHRKTITEIMKEVCAVAMADGYPLPSDIIQKNISHTEKMTPYKTSMLVDFEAHRPLEVEAILSNAIRIATDHGVAVPQLEKTEALLRNKLTHEQNSH